MLRGSSRKAPRNGWTVVRLSGTPRQIGYQHGYLLAPEIADLEQVYLLEMTHDTGKDWNFFREAAREVWWPHIDQEYREELQGIVEGLKKIGAKLTKISVHNPVHFSKSPKHQIFAILFSA